LQFFVISAARRLFINTETHLKEDRCDVREMRGSYARFRFHGACAPSSLAHTLTGGTYTVCTHGDIRGGLCVEVAWPSDPNGHVPRTPPLDWYDFEIFHVYAVEFYIDSLREAGGTSFVEYEIDETEPQSSQWRRAMGFVTHVLDDLDISHPRAVHASTEFQDFVSRC
jgi:hypothetical protein